MRITKLNVGYMPLVDAAPYIIAQEMGFAAAEGLELDLIRAPSWSGLRDMLAFGRVDAAHMLSAVPVAMSMGVGGIPGRIIVPAVTSVNGNVIGVSQPLYARMQEQGTNLDFADAASIGHGLMRAAGETLRIGVPFPFSMHAELLYYWLSSLGYAAPQGIAIKTVPPPLMADALAADEIDAFCVGEPWGSISVERGYGSLILPVSAIWSFAPEKVLAVREEWANSEMELLSRLTHALWQAGRWLADSGNLLAASEALAQKQYLQSPSEVIERALSGRLIVDQSGTSRQVQNFLEFHAGAANFPWRSQGSWIAQQLAARLGLDRSQAMTAGRSVFRSDLYRIAMQRTGADLPGASEKVEGGIDARQPAASEGGTLYLEPNTFFDRVVFDPGPHS